MAIAGPRETQHSNKRVYYPTRDGKPVAETEKHFIETINCVQGLRYWYQDRQDVYVCGNNFIYWEEGNAKARVSPDCYVVYGVEKRVRDSYKAWEESGRLPNVVFEFTSKKTRAEDVEVKLPLYEQVWGVSEYFTFDPTGDYLHPRLQGYRLSGGRWVRLEFAEDRMHSEELNLHLVVTGEQMRLFDPAVGRFLPTFSEAMEQKEEAERQVAITEHLLAEQRQRVSEETQRAESEQRRAETQETENARLRLELEALRRQSNRAE